MPERPSKRRSASVQLVAQAADPLTEVLVIDHRFAVAARGVGRVEGAFAPGLYRVKFRAGTAQDEVQTALAPGAEPVTIQGRPLHERSIGVQRARTVQAAGDQGRTPDATLGEGSELLLSFAFPDEAGPPPRDGISLHSAEGSPLWRLDLGATPDGSVRLAVDPGFYRLRFTRSSGEWREQGLIAVRRSHTHYVVPLCPERSDDVASRGSARDWRPDFRAANLRVEAGARGTPQDEATAARLLEIAKQSLLTRSRRVAKPALDQLLDQKFSSPMLGVMALHLARLQRMTATESQRWSGVADRLAQRLPGSADVVALSLAFRRGGGSKPPKRRLADVVRSRAVTHPPLLKASWDLLVDLSADHPDLLAAGTLAEEVADRICGDGPWCTWTSPVTELEVSPLDDLFVALGMPLEKERGETVAAALWPVRRFIQRSLQEFAAEAAVRLRLTALEQTLLLVVTQSGMLLGPRGDSDLSRSELRTLVSALRVPASTVSRLVTSLSRKIRVARAVPAQREVELPERPSARDDNTVPG